MKLTTRGQAMLDKSRNQRYNAVDYIQTMMMWASDNLSREEIVEIIKGDEGKAVGLENLQRQIIELEEMLMAKKKEFLKKSLALYFMKQEKPNKNESELAVTNEWINSISRRYQYREG